MTTHSPRASRIGQQRLKRCPKHGQIIFGHAPHDPVINRCIGVDENVAKRDDLAMALDAFGNFRIVLREFRERFTMISNWRSSAERSNSSLRYGSDRTALYRRSAYYVDRILKGTKSSDLPIEQPTTFEFVMNLKTAKTLGITIPPSVMVRATKVIE